MNVWLHSAAISEWIQLNVGFCLLILSFLLIIPWYYRLVYVSVRLLKKTIMIGISLFYLDIWKLYRDLLFERILIFSFDLRRMWYVEHSASLIMFSCLLGELDESVQSILPNCLYTKVRSCQLLSRNWAGCVVDSRK